MTRTRRTARVATSLAIAALAAFVAGATLPAGAAPAAPSTPAATRAATSEDGLPGLRRGQAALDAVASKIDRVVVTFTSGRIVDTGVQQLQGRVSVDVA